MRILKNYYEFISEKQFPDSKEIGLIEKPVSIRFNTELKSHVWNDRIHGRKGIENSEIDLNDINDLINKSVEQLTIDLMTNKLDILDRFILTSPTLSIVCQLVSGKYNFDLVVVTAMNKSAGKSLYIGDGQYVYDVSTKTSYRHKSRRYVVKDAPVIMRKRRNRNISEGKSNDGFTEITFTLIEDDNKEVMFDILPSGKVIDIYCYSDGIPTWYNYKLDREVKIRTKQGKNPLFLHISPTKTNILNIIKRCVGYPHIENEDQFILLDTMLKYYKIHNSVGYDWEYEDINELNHQSVGAILGVNQPGYGQGAHHGNWGVNYGSSNKSVRSTFGEKGNSIDPHLPGQKEKQTDFPSVVYDSENDIYLTGDDVKELLNDYNIKCKQNSEVPQEFSNIDSSTIKFIRMYLNK